MLSLSHTHTHTLLPHPPSQISKSENVTKEREDAQLLGNISFGGVGATLGPRPLNIHLHSSDGVRPNFPGDRKAGTSGLNRNAARPNSAGALLGHGIARQGSSSSGSGLAPINPRIPPTAAVQHDNATTHGAKRASNRPRPQSALPERVTAFPSAVPSSSFDRAFADDLAGDVGAVDYGIAAINGFDAGRFGDNRPSSAPNYLGAGFMNQYGRIEMLPPAAAFTNATAGGAHGTAAIKYKKAESIYRAPYFNMAVFNKDGVAGGVGAAPDSSHGRRGSYISAGNGKPNRPQSAVDRAVNLGKIIPSYLLPREKDRTPKRVDEQNAAAINQKLAFMYDDNLAQRLGVAVAPAPSGTEREREREGHPVVGRMPPVVPRASERTRGATAVETMRDKGGIVFLVK